MTLNRALLMASLFAAVTLPAFAQNVAVVNGKPIPESHLDMVVKQATAQGQQKDTPELREQIKQSLIDREVLVQAAEKLGLDKTADVKNEVQMAHQSILIHALVDDFVKKHPVSDADISAFYDHYKAAKGDKEYHVHHIETATEDEAKAIIAKLKAGAKFEDLVKQSKDASAESNGGDLGWISPAGFNKTFADAMVTLKKGQVTDTPIKIDSSYHVIRLDDVRDTKFPTLAEAKPQISEKLEQQKLQQYQEELRKKAKIQ